MQNSAVMAIRVGVLLVCLVAVPVIAICGKNAPEVVKALIRDYTGTSAKVASPNAGSTDAPVFRPGVLGPAAGSQSQQSGAPAALPGSGTPAAVRPSNIESGLPRELPAASLGPNAASQAGRLPNGQTGVQTTAGDGSQGPAVTPVGHQVDILKRSNNESDRHALTGSGNEKSSATGFPPDYFRAAETRLRDLGATYYLLETLGSAGDQYRFVCKVAAIGQPDQMLAFFAVDRDPLAAMNNVVRQVEGWRSHLTQ
jgi:hypothetical protein